MVSVPVQYVKPHLGCYAESEIRKTLIISGIFSHFVHDQCDHCIVALILGIHAYKPEQ